MSSVYIVNNKKMFSDIVFVSETEDDLLEDLTDKIKSAIFSTDIEKRKFIMYN